MKNIFKNLALLIATISFTTMAASPVNALYDPNSPNGSACPNLEEGMMCITQAPAEPAVPNNRLAVLLRLVTHADISVNAKIELIKILLRPNASQDDITTVDSDEIDQKADDESDKPRRPESSTSNVVDSSESRDGLASFRLSFDLRSFGNDNYISSNLAESFDFEILDGSFDVVATNIDLDQSELGGFV